MQEALEGMNRRRGRGAEEGFEVGGGMNGRQCRNLLGNGKGEGATVAY